MEKDKTIYKLSLDFAVRIVNLYKYLTNEKKEFVMSKQILRSGTSIGANANEGQCAQSLPDFLTKFQISYKEVNETKYWLDLLYMTEYIDENQYESICTDCDQLKKILSSITKSTREKINNLPNGKQLLTPNS
jgi:four helix bundle protein